MGENNAHIPRVRVQDELGRVVNVFLLPSDGEGLTVGRALHADASLPSKDVSPLHLRIRWDSTFGRVVVTDLGSTTGTYLDGRRLTPEVPYAWHSGQHLRIGCYTLKLIMSGSASGAPDGSAQPAGAADTPSTPAPRLRRFGVALLIGTLAALTLVAHIVLSRAVEILSFALIADGPEAVVRFQVVNAQRVELLVDGRPADPQRLSFDPNTGAGAYRVRPDERNFTLIAYDHLGQPATSRLISIAPIKTPRPTLTPSPDEIGLAVFAFNGVNKVNDLSDIILSKGESLLIEWDVVNAEAVELQPAGTFKPQDAVRVAPNETTVYTLIARSRLEEVRRSVKVIVVDAQATADAQRAATTTATALARATAQTMEARYGQYSGVWTNDDPTTDGITRLVISNVGPTITVQAFARCQARECDWGARRQPFIGEPFSITFAFGDGVMRRLTFARVGDKLRVTDADSRGPIRTYTFSLARPPLAP